jgi:hypothetical protein
VERGATLAPAILPTFALAGATQLGDCHGFVELRNSAEHLAHEGRVGVSSMKALGLSAR